VGVLYIGRKGLLFVPSKGSAKKHRPLEIFPLRCITTSLVAPRPLNAIQRLIIPHPQKRLEIQKDGTSWCFTLPRPEETHMRIARCIETLAAVPSGSEASAR